MAENHIFKDVNITIEGEVKYCSSPFENPMNAQEYISYLTRDREKWRVWFKDCCEDPDFDKFAISRLKDGNIIRQEEEDIEPPYKRPGNIPLGGRRVRALKPVVIPWKFKKDKD